MIWTCFLTLILDPLRISKRQSSLYYTPENDIPNSLEEDSSSSEDEEEDSSSDYMKGIFSLKIFNYKETKIEF